MSAPEYLFIAWAFYSFLRLSIDWFAFKKHKYITVFPILQLVAIGVIYITQHFMIGLVISAFANIVYYWFIKPKVIDLYKKTTS